MSLLFSWLYEVSREIINYCAQYLQVTCFTLLIWSLPFENRKIMESEYWGIYPCTSTDVLRHCCALVVTYKPSNLVSFCLFCLVNDFRSLSNSSSCFVALQRQINVSFITANSDCPRQKLSTNKQKITQILPQKNSKFIEVQIRKSI